MAEVLRVFSHHIYLNVDAGCRSRDEILSFSLKAATGSKTANAGRFNICINYLTNQAQEQLCTNLVIRS